MWRVRQVAAILQIPGKAPMQEKQSSCQPARVSPGSTMQAEGGSCLGKIWGSEAVSSFGPATRSVYQKQTNKTVEGVFSGRPYWGGSG